ncbi:MAG: polyprenyl synthetase family protein [bacterium]
MVRSIALNELTAPIREELARFDVLESESLGDESELIRSVSRHLLLSKGKRLRPTFTFMIAKVTGFESDHLAEAALAVEMIHTATLLHDDVVDESDTRRGQVTVNSEWNNLVSVLMGDYFFAKAFTLLVRTGSLEMLRRVSEATERVSVGELRQIEESFNYDLSEQDYLRIISDKTAALFAAAAIAPPLLGGAPREAIEALDRFGEHSGCAFQIADDLLDFVGEQSRTGKKPGIDLQQGKITLPLIHALQKTQAGTRKSIIDILDNGVDDGDFERVLDFLHDSGGIDYARQRAQSLCDQALSYLAPYYNSPYYANLEELATFAIKRDV